jgi:hypothetical protein
VDHWLKEGLTLSTPTDTQALASITKVQDLMLNSAKAWDWDYEKIHNMFDNTIENRIMQTPLLASVREDALVWKMEYDGVYSVRSAYKHCLNTTCIQDRHGRYCSKLASKNPTKSE